MLCSWSLETDQSLPGSTTTTTIHTWETAGGAEVLPCENEKHLGI